MLEYQTSTTQLTNSITEKLETIMTTYNRTANKTPLMSRFVKLLCSVAFLGMLTGTAYAGPILGSLQYNGIFFPKTGTGPYTSASLDTATYLDFISPSSYAIGSGALAGLTGPGTLELFDFAILPFVGTVGSPVPVWTDIGPGDLTFSLSSLTIVEQSGGPGLTDILVLSGTGVFTATGFDATDAIWSLTAQDTGDGTPILTFSASSNVSEPSMLTLLGLTLLGAGLTRRRKARKSA